MAIQKTLAINLTDKEFPETINAINDLADSMAKSDETRPSVRKLAAEIIIVGCKQKFKELSAPSEMNNSSDDVLNHNKPETLCQGNS